MEISDIRRELGLENIDLEDIDRIKFQLQQINDTISGGLRSANFKVFPTAYVINAQDSLDETYPLYVHFFIIPEMVKIVSIKLSFWLLNFRAYSKGAKSGGGSTSGSGGGQTSSSVTTPSGGGSTSGATGSASGGGSTSGATGSASGGGSTSGGGGGQTSSSVTTPSGGGATSGNEQAHRHNIALGNAITGNIVYWTPPDNSTPGTFNCSGGGSPDTSIPQAVHTHSTPNHTHPAHTHTVANHTHTTPAHTHPNHTHITPNHTHPNHTHSTPNHTHPAHSHTVSDHSHTTPNHTHDLTFGIFEEETSPTIVPSISRDNGRTYSLPLGSYTKDQETLDITRFIDTAGSKMIKFTSNARARLSVQVTIKLDVKARS